MSRHPLVTIAIPTFNRAGRFLRQSLEAALGQTYRELEILVSDNASEDDTEDVVRSYDDSRIRYVKQPQNLGANGNFNYLVEHAAGAYLLLLLDDDLIDADFIEACMAAIARRPEARMVRTGARTLKGERIVSTRENRCDGLSPAAFYLAYFRRQTNIYFCSTLFHTQTLRDFGGLHSTHELLEDCVAVTRFVAHHPRIDLLEPRATFRWHEFNRGSTIAIDRWSEDSLDLLELMVAASAERANEVRREGLRYFTRLNYNRLSRTGVRDPGRYLYVFRTFGRSYHPLAYALDSWVVRRSQRAMRRLVGNGAAT